MIDARFDQVNSLSNKGEDTFIMRGDIHQAPLVGQVVNLKGYPYVVYDIGWAFDEWHNELRQHCYIRCLPRPSAQK